MCKCGNTLTSSSSTCNKCQEPACHPCFEKKKDCNNLCDDTAAKPIDSCITQQYCGEGCETIIEAKCIIFTDGTSLEDKMLAIFNFLKCVCEQNPQCKGVGSPSGNNKICI